MKLSILAAIVLMVGQGWGAELVCKSTCTSEELGLREMVASIFVENPKPPMIEWYCMGSVIAIVISWSLNHSILWAMLHCIFGWLYVIYYAIFLR